MVAVRILLAIDQDIAWEGLRLLVGEQSNLELIAVASNARSALRLARKHQPEVVVMDLNIPLPSIIRTAKHMFADMPAVKVITVSMQTDHLYVEKSIMAGISGYLLKECAYEELIPAINHVMAGKTYLSPDIRIQAP